MYVDKNSNIAANFFSHFFHPDLWGEKEIEKFTLEKKKVFDIIRYMKNYQGDLYRLKAKKPLKDYRFSDEREWRFVLPVSSKNPMLINCVDKKTDQIIELKRDSNQSIEYERLQFGPDDINYIIIKTEKERDSIIARLPQIKDGHDKNSVARLSSRIISVQQIKSDF